MKIKNPTIISNENITEIAVNNLFENSLNIVAPTCDVTDEVVDYIDFEDFITVDENGVSVPTQFIIESDDDLGEIMVASKEMKVAFTKEQLQEEVKRIIKDEYPEAWNEFINVNTDK